MAKDFTNKQFGKSLRGYAPDDVDKYLEYINIEYRKLERHCSDSDRKLVLALRKLEALTEEVQKITEITDLGTASVVQEEEAPDTKAAEEAARAMTEKAGREADAIREAAAKDAEIICDEARQRAEEVLKFAKAKAEKTVASAEEEAEAIRLAATKRARAAAERIITDAALAGRKILRDAESKADDACRDVMGIYRAAEEIYGEVTSFRGNLFSLYSNHIESIETITGNAHSLVDAVDEIIRDIDGEQKTADAVAEEFRETLHGGAVEEKKDELKEQEEAAEVQEQTADEAATEPEISESVTEPAESSEPEETEETEETEEIPESEEEAEPEKESAEEAEEDDGYGEPLAPKKDLFLDLDDGEYYDSFDELPGEEDNEAEEAEEIAEAEEETEEEDGESEEAEEADFEAEPEEEENAEDGEEISDFVDPVPVKDAIKPGGDGEMTIGFVKEERGVEENDFELPDEVSGATGVLDIVKKLNGGVQKPTEDEDFDLERLFGSDASVSEDEFDRVFSNGDVKNSMDEVLRQPHVSPTEPTNPKKHSKF